VAGSYTTLRDELADVERYVALERSRLGERLAIRLRIAPEVLSVVLPYLAVQQLVENAVRNGLAGRPRGGTVSITADNVGAECVIAVEDDGVGLDPAELVGEPDEADLSGPVAVLGDVDRKVRAAFGDDFGLVVDTAVDRGMKVTMRVPKFRAGIRA
jgi:two-component system LytT family sensor kinase